MEDLNIEEVALPPNYNVQDPSTELRMDSNVKSPNISITRPLQISSPKSNSPLPRQGSPLRKISNLSSPERGSLNRTMNTKKRDRSPKSPSAGSETQETMSNMVKRSIQNGANKIDNGSLNNPSIKSQNVENNIQDTIADLQPKGSNIRKYVDEITETVKELSKSIDHSQSPELNSNINKISNMSKILTDEAYALRQSIRHLSEDINRTKQELGMKQEDVNFPYHLFLIELIINKIHMKCECFEFSYDNLVISATFLGKPPIILYDPSYGKISNFNKLNVGKSTLFAMTYDKICSINEFIVNLQIAKKPPCSNCDTKIAETYMDYTNEFVNLREELCKKWSDEQPNDNILCTTSTPLSKNLFYLACCNNDQSDPIGVIEITIRMSFLGKEITTVFNATSKPQGTSFLMKEDHGMSLYSCQKVEMDRHGKILLDEEVFSRKEHPHSAYNNSSTRRSASPYSDYSSAQESLKRAAVPPHFYTNRGDEGPKYDEIFTKMNENELKIKVPKTTKVERSGKYETIQDLCTCESPLQPTGDQIQFELPRDASQIRDQNTYTSNLKYTYNKCEAIRDKRDKKIVNVTPTNCPAPVNIEKEIHPNKDVFILKIGKKLETKDKKTDLEIELVTPKFPDAKRAEQNQMSQQCSTVKLEDKSKSSNKKAKKGKSKTNVAKKKEKKGKKAKKSKNKK